MLPSNHACSKQLGNVIVAFAMMAHMYIEIKKTIENPTSLTFSNELLTVSKIGYDLNIIRQTACLFFYPTVVESYAALFSCTAVVQASDSMTASTISFKELVKVC